MDWNEKARRFLDVSDRFRLGDLPTEQSHPLTTNLSDLARNDVAAAIDILIRVERDAVAVLSDHLGRLRDLRHSIATTFDRGHRVFLCGCGATGRLALSLESLWRELVAESTPAASGSESGASAVNTAAADRDKVFSFMAGGDYALVRSIENFEDYPEFGARQLHDSGYQAGDLLIASTEGGETPFVLGAVAEAARIGGNAPYLLYCNPDEVLVPMLERCRLLIEDPRVEKISMPVGPMAICGSTRLQATTVLMLAIGTALFSLVTGRPLEDDIEEMSRCLAFPVFAGLEPLIRAEADCYANGDVLLHQTTDYPLTVVTDLTERSPTFSLAGFENRAQQSAKTIAQPPLSWTYLWIPGSQNSAVSWRRLLGRHPRTLTWPDFEKPYGIHATLGFDFSDHGKLLRLTENPTRAHHAYSITRNQGEIALSLNGKEFSLPRPESLLVENLLLKVALNISSTLVMGRLGRFEGNHMLWVKASNNKLVDRAARQVGYLLDRDGAKPFEYSEVVRALFRNLETLAHDESIVMRTYHDLKLVSRKT